MSHTKASSRSTAHDSFAFCLVSDLCYWSPSLLSMSSWYTERHVIGSLVVPTHTLSSTNTARSLQELLALAFLRQPAPLISSHIRANSPHALLIFLSHSSPQHSLTPQEDNRRDATSSPTGTHV